METVMDFIFWGSKITANGDCSHEIRRRLLLGSKVMTNLVQFSQFSRYGQEELSHRELILDKLPGRAGTLSTQGSFHHQSGIQGSGPTKFPSASGLKPMCLQAGLGSPSWDSAIPLQVEHT